MRLIRRGMQARFGNVTGYNSSKRQGVAYYRLGLCGDYKRMQGKEAA